MIHYLNSIDTQLFLFINRLHSPFFDTIMYWLSDKWIWVPFYLLIVFLVVRHYKMKGLLIILAAGIVIALCDQTASHLIKNAVMRLRPSHQPALDGLVHLSKAGPGGLYGFASSHAANTFGLATYMLFMLDKKLNPLKYILFVWAILVTYSRIYNGVHYPGDIIAGAMIGILWGWLIAKLFHHFENRKLRRDLQKK